MKLSLPAAGPSAPVLVSACSALVLVSACSGGAHPRVTVPHGATTSAVRTPTRPDRLPDPVRSPLPVGSKTLYTGSGHGAGGVTLPASAGKAPSVTVMWTCAGPSGFDITAAGKSLAGSGCGDASGVFSAELPRANMRELVWTFSAADSVIWRIVVAQSPPD
ncbi:hypothetical protein [Streptomyces fagopyri]|uniref:hypothetical protein n=1 Tax=Streptomyces fagopyri TaxID=2662397 RepID=UPI0033EAC9DA